MSVIIKGMEMPKSCNDCDIMVYTQDEGYFCPLLEDRNVFNNNHKKEEDCPLAELKGENND